MAQTDAGRTDDTVIVRPAAETTQIAQPVECPVCFTENAPGEVWCADCGFRLDATPEQTQIEAPAFLLVDADDPERQYPIAAGETSVGRQNADLLLTNPTVSRTHAKLIVEGDVCSVVDLGSANGTFINGQRIEPNVPVQLRPGDEVVFGTVRLRVPGEAEPALRPQAEQPARPVLGRLILVADSPAEYPLHEGLNAVGRSGDNDVVLSFDGFVSGHHCNIILDADACFVEDLNSRNGTFVGGQRVEPGRPRELMDGDELLLGKTTLRLSLSLPEGDGIDLVEPDHTPQ
jgi:pSer/pThr/pTyr-binding forkhead associated (FHA) protein